MEANEILHLVIEARKKGNFGGRPLLDIIQPDLAERNIKIGRDRFYDLLRKNDMLIRPRRRYVRTTNSSHHYRKWPNLIEKMEILRPEEVWVSDITYITTRKGFLYLFLITDSYSRKIMGYHLSHRMLAKGAVSALRMALRRRDYPDRSLIHHSDRGIQYCSKHYVEALQEQQIAISMAEKGNPYQNPIAERINRTIKEQFRMGQVFDNYPQALITLNNAVQNYNTVKPHSSCDKMTPQEAHLTEGLLKKHWKNYRKINRDGGADALQTSSQV